MFSPFLKYFKKQWLKKHRAQKIMDAMDLFDKGEIDIQGFLTLIVSLNDCFNKQDLFDSVHMDSNLSGMSSEMKASTLSLSTSDSNTSQISDSSIFQMNPCNHVGIKFWLIIKNRTMILTILAVVNQNVQRVKKLLKKLSNLCVRLYSEKT
ncbi:uncharacterized protein LOC133839663 [Drosophila sulfurigaster albostrigata]|uniref:uncharacterized protein LOC133839663 n=1 Tax=Drosophila sulfurigaster albostrigata TaxID=89887 RepID=UPI002D21C216|nr:uncharacterized protein LOC133839663 [Drosophila sulfurigaster albostrigata]